MCKEALQPTATATSYKASTTVTQTANTHRVHKRLCAVCSSGEQADLCMNQLILFLVLLAIPLEVLLYLCFLLGCEQAVRPVPPAELQEALSLGPAQQQLPIITPVLYCAILLKGTEGYRRLQKGTEGH